MPQLYPVNKGKVINTYGHLLVCICVFVLCMYVHVHRVFVVVGECLWLCAPHAYWYCIHLHITRGCLLHMSVCLHYVLVVPVYCVRHVLG